MLGPQPIGYWKKNCDKTFKCLIAGNTYVVCKDFKDFDGHWHLVGERWKFLGYSFFPYENGLSLFVSLDDHSEWHIRMQWTEEEQGPIVDALEEYVTLSF